MLRDSPESGYDWGWERVEPDQGGGRANEICGWDVCLRNSFLGPGSWLRKKEREEDMSRAHSSETPIDTVL